MQKPQVGKISPACGFLFRPAKPSSPAGKIENTNVLREKNARGMIKEALNKSLHALTVSFSVMLCQMPLDVAMLRLRTIFLA